MSDKKCPNCGACKECGAHPPQVVPMPYPVYPQPIYPSSPWARPYPNYPRPTRTATAGGYSGIASSPPGTYRNINPGEVH